MNCFIFFCYTYVPGKFLVMTVGTQEFSINVSIVRISFVFLMTLEDWLRLDSSQDRFFKSFV